MNIPTFAVIVVNYNSGDLIKKCIASLLGQTVIPSRIIVVDNASADESINHLRDMKNRNEIELIESAENLGFAAANNLAIAGVTDCDYVALLNPDAIAKSDWLEVIGMAIRKYLDYDCYASCMLDYTEHDIIDGMGDAYHINGKAWPINKGQRLSAVENVDAEVFAPCAGAAVYKTDSFKKVNGFDDRYFCYHEDVDLGFRLRLAGSRTMYLKDALVYHVGSAISGKGSNFSIYYAHRNLVWTYFKNMPARLLAISLPAHLALNLITVIYFLLIRRNVIIAKSKLNAFGGLLPILRSRRKIQKNRAISDVDLLPYLRMSNTMRKFASMIL